jgi:hypothetical protein
MLCKRSACVRAVVCVKKTKLVTGGAASQNSTWPCTRTWLRLVLFRHRLDPGCFLLRASAGVDVRDEAGQGRLVRQNNGRPGLGGVEHQLLGVVGQEHSAICQL